VARVRLADAEPNRLGTLSAANRRTIYKYIHPGGAQSCQLVMGLTDLEQGSVWNTMPPHTHERRTEVYLYFDMDSDSLIVHLMGAPGETKSVVLRDREAIISPSWSIHCGAGTTNYSFVWAMGGENQEFSDMDASPMNTLL
jgi:4-deoxy-L-threo-5-hexosulose-uronate ketol-isomerase